MRRTRIAGMAALIFTTIVATGGPAFAAAPGNDTYPGRTVVGALPFTDQVDTTAATRDADDAAIGAQCAGVPAFDASVWYQVTATSNAGLAADVSASNYSAGVFVATGGPGNWTLVACAPGAVGWATTAGQTYSVIAFDDQMDGGGNGGVLKITIDLIPPPPTINVTVNPTGVFNAKTGSATVSGNVTCTGASQFAFLDVQLSQSVGRFIIRGFGGTNVTCDGATRPWSVQVLGDNGTFAGGKALSVTFAVACGAFDCGVDFQERIIQLKGGRR